MDATRGLDTDTEFDWQPVHVVTPRGRWHIAMQNLVTGVLTTPEACNLDDSGKLTLFPDLPEQTRAIDLCHRCHQVDF